MINGSFMGNTNGIGALNNVDPCMFGLFGISRSMCAVRCGAMRA